MNNVFDYLIDMFNNGYRISFTLNECGFLSVNQYLDEYIDGKPVSRSKCCTLASIKFDELRSAEKIESFCAKVRIRLLPDNRIDLD